MVNFLGTETVPSSGSSSPTTMRKRVVLPEPLGPTSPTFSPGLSWKEASTKTSCLPYCLLMLEKEINYQASRREIIAGMKFACFTIMAAPFLLGQQPCADLASFKMPGAAITITKAEQVPAAAPGTVRV